MSNLPSPRPVRSNAMPPSAADVQRLIAHELQLVQSTRSRRLSPGEEKSAMLTPASLLFGSFIGLFFIAPLGFLWTIVAVLVAIVVLIVSSRTLPNPWMVLIPMNDEQNQLRGSSVGALTVTALLTGLLPGFLATFILLAVIAFSGHRAWLIYQNRF